uniref:Uncharacterized protein n=1 Tax=Molossus molossus TaxID=27622 RepID=A0A7J8DCN1_MOLMO|nr:hypothetical protein HJG59_009415 [Molossus molossus]
MMNLYMCITPGGLRFLCLQSTLMWGENIFQPEIPSERRPGPRPTPKAEREGSPGHQPSGRGGGRGLRRGNQRTGERGGARGPRPLTFWETVSGATGAQGSAVFGESRDTCLPPRPDHSRRDADPCGDRHGRCPSTPGPQLHPPRGLDSPAPATTTASLPLRAPTCSWWEVTL